MFFVKMTVHHYEVHDYFAEDSHVDSCLLGSEVQKSPFSSFSIV